MTTTVLDPGGWGQCHSVEAKLRSSSSLAPPAPLSSHSCSFPLASAAHFQTFYLTGLWSDPTGLGGLHLEQVPMVVKFKPSYENVWTALERETELKCCPMDISALQQDPKCAGRFQETPTGGPATPRLFQPHHAYFFPREACTSSR